MDDVSGSCPSLTFRVEGQTVYTSNATEFKSGPCKDIVEGSAVKIEGRRMSDGRVRGDTVEISNRGPGNGGNGDDRVDLEGVVQDLSGSCPALTFRVSGVTVFTTADTRFRDGGCRGVQKGASVEVRGRRQPDGRVFAEEVEVDD